MDQNAKKRNKLLAEQVIKALESRNMEAYYAENKEEALAKALELMPEGSSVAWGGSMSIKEIGLTQAVHDGNYVVYDRDQATTPEEKTEITKKAFFSDYFLASTNAISEDGILVNIDGISNRVAAIAFGPKNVIMIVGMNKVVRSEEDAMARAKHIAAPINAQRFGKTPCTVTGKCSECKSPGCICCQTMITRFSLAPKRIKVILVNEELGF
ncbi:MAG: lactate utilization protein [Bariatricus sp.]|nr:lactate utilization protein [Bariatricus sp.]